MNQTIDIANKLGANFGSGDPQVDAAAQEGKPDRSASKGAGQGQGEDASFDAYGNQGEPGQYAQPGQYGAVTGGGFGGGIGGLAKDAQGQPLSARKHRDSAYEGMEHGDSTSTGGYGKNDKGSSFSRANQMGADNTAAVFDDEENEGRKTGYSTPGYLREGVVRKNKIQDQGARIKAHRSEDPEAAERRNNQNVYGKQADDRGAVNADEPNN